MVVVCAWGISRGSLSAYDGGGASREVVLLRTVVVVSGTSREVVLLPTVVGVLLER